MKRMLVFALLFVFLLGCAHPLIGRSVHNKGNPYWCHMVRSPEYCTILTQHLRINIKVDTGTEEGEYIINGDAEFLTTKGFSRVVVEKSDFYFILAKNGIITDVISFMLAGDDVQNKLPLNLKFKTKPFDAVSLDYYFYVIG